MKNILFACIAIIACNAAIAQTDYSGAYGYSMKPQGDPPKMESNRGPEGRLVLLKMDGNKYRFWLDITKGWPTYSVGETDGTIILVNDTASFDNTFENAINPCMLKFNYSNAVMHISSLSASFNCGFGNGVTADGEYPRLKVQPALNNDWLKKEYGQSPKAVISANKAEIFQDENCMRPFSSKKYFVKGDNIFLIADSDKAIYTEFIPSPGKFVYGWIRKSDLSIVGQ